jgi:hypothetical protein
MRWAAGAAVGALALFGARQMWVYGTALWDYFGPDPALRDWPVVGAPSREDADGR